MRTNVRRASAAAVACLLVSALGGCGTRVKREEATAAPATSSPVATVHGESAPGGAPGTPVADGSDATGTPAPAGTPSATAPVASGSAGSGQPPSGAAGAGTRAAGGPRSSAGMAPVPDRTTSGKGPNPQATGSSGGSNNAGDAALPGQPAPATPGCPNPCAPLVIGSVGTWSGLVGQNVVGGLHALQAWVAATNAAGGVNGHQVRLVTADDGTDPARHRALVQELVERRGVVAFVYNAAVFSGHASIGYLEERKIPVVGGSGTEPWYTTSPMFFTQVIAGEVAIEATVASYARSAKAMGIAKMGLITCSDGVQVCQDTARVAPGYIKRYGLELAYQGQASLAQPDFTANCLAARNAGAEILYLALDANSYSRFGKGCASVGYKPRYGIAQPVMLADLAKDPNLQGSPGVSYTAPFFFGANPGIARFQKAMGQYAAKAPLTGSASLGWSAAELLGASARRLSPTPTSADVLEGVWSLNGDDLSGLTAPLRFKRGGPTVPPVCYWQVIVTNNSYQSPDQGQRHCERA
ncbi:MAG TPA: ABC transporter substrate-binding protein [Acidimicrobiia bacterium]|nr:ABC transporter substrate-binding protein [Acidimicrobiia bacterium]